MHCIAKNKERKQMPCVEFRLFIHFFQVYSITVCTCMYRLIEIRVRMSHEMPFLRTIPHTRPAA